MRSVHALEGRLDTQQLFRQLLLLLTGDVGWYGALHSQVGPLVALAADGLLPSSQTVALVLPTGLEVAQAGEQLPADVNGDVFGEGLVLPVALDRALELIGRDVRQAAASSARVPASAVEVVIKITAATAGHDKEQARLATPAAERAHEVVLVAVGALAGNSVGSEDPLYLLERLRGDEDRVLALVLDATPGDEADVVPVAQDVVQLVWWQRPRGSLRSRPLRESAFSQLGSQRLEAVAAGCVGLESPFHEAGALRIHLDRARLMPRVDAADVQIAKGCDVRRAASTDLLLRALDDLVGEVAGVELGDRTHDPVHQGAARRLVDVLGDADQLRAAGMDGGGDRDVVEAVARQAVDLVDDHVVDGLGCQEAQHPLQRWPVGRAGGLTALNEDFGNAGAEGGSSFLTGVPLGRDGVAVRVTLTLKLLLGAYADVQHSPRLGGRHGLELVAHAVTPVLRGVRARS